MTELQEVAELLFGEVGPELISKINPTQSDVATRDRRKRAVTAGLSAIGATAGAGGMALAGHKYGSAYRAARFGSGQLKAVKQSKKVTGMQHQLRPIASRGSALKAAARSEKGAAALLPLEVAGLGGEVMATRILHGDTKKKQMSKSIAEIPESASFPSKKNITRAAVTSAARAAGKGLEQTKKKGMFRRVPDKVTTHNVKKADDRVEVVWDGEIAKADSDKQQIFGWASVVEVGGEPVVDLQGDRISIDEMEKAGYSYVMKSRKGGDMHLRDNWEPVQKSEMIESFIVTDEKRKAMGLPDDVPTGWWVGFQVQDPQVWADIKAGKRTGFSIHGSGRRSPL